MVRCYISVVLATYNGEKYLSQQIESILDQTYSIGEIIVVDDCSTDKTWDVLSSFASRNAQIKIYRNNSNLGVVKTFEYGLTLCSGDFIALADQDDYWLPKKLEVLINNIEDNWLIHSDAYIADCHLNIINESFSAIKPYHDNSLNMYYMRNNVTGCTALLRRQLIELAIPFPDDVIMHDHYLALCARQYGKLAYIDQRLIKYRQHANNTIGVARPQSYDFMVDNYRKHIQFLDGLITSSKVKFDCYQIKIVRNYFSSIVEVKFPKIETIFWVFSKLGVLSTLSLLFFSTVSKKTARFAFNLKNK